MIRIYYRMRKMKKLITILKLLILLGVVVGIPVYIGVYHQEFLSQFNSLEDVNAFLDRYQTASVFVYFAIQVLQLVICIIPGQAMQFAGGYVFGIGLGYLLSITGAAVGTVLTFYLARVLGRDALHLFFDEKKIAHFVEKLNSKKALIVVFVIYLIPGLPKDLITYAAGVSEIKLKPFLILSLVGRTPGMLCSIILGNLFNNGSYIGILVLSIVVAVACIWGVRHHEKLTELIDKGYQRLVKG